MAEELAKITKNAKQVKHLHTCAYIADVICANMLVNICKHTCMYEVLMAEGKG